MEPRVSVVIPMYNAEQYLGLAVDGVRAQTFADWELVLFDDGSRDRTLEIARRYADQDQRIRVIAAENSGTARARNSGLTATMPGSEFVTFLDNDDVWDPDALARLTQALDEQRESPAAHGLARAIDPRGCQYPGDDLAQTMARRREIRHGRIVDAPSGAPTTFEALLVENFPVTPGTVLIRRTVLNKVGGYVPSTVPCDDWDMHLRVARHGGIALVDHVVLNWRRHPNAASYTTRRWRQAYLRVRGRSVLSSENTREQRAAAIGAFRWTCRNTWADFTVQLRSRQLKTSARLLARWALCQAAYWRVLRAAGAT